MNSRFPADGVPLERLHVGPVEWAGVIASDAPMWSGAALEFEVPPRVRFRMSATADGGAHVTGRLDAVMRLACRRCLGEIHWPLKLMLDLWFEPSVRVWDEEGGVYSLEADATTVDLGRALREEICLAIPEYPLCRDDCRGLCPRCGADRNDTTCECGEEEIDPRWAALRRATEEG